MPCETLVLVLGDQLSQNLHSLQVADKANSVILMAEVAEEASYVKHHKKKIAFLFSAMRHFAAELRDKGWKLDYIQFDDPANTQSLIGELERAVERHQSKSVYVTEAGEYRVQQMLTGWGDDFAGDMHVLSDDRFLCTHDEFEAWADGRKQLRMEYFYREMRRKTGLLMNGDDPEGGKWNYDADNRKPANADLFLPQPHFVSPDIITEEVLTLVGGSFSDHFGDLKPFWFAVTREEAETALTHFIETALPHFGDYQDAMLTDQKFLYHSVLSAYINAGLLDPLEVCKRVEAAYRAGHAPLNAAEGFIRQIIGWREYVRGIYWLKMPGYIEENFLGAIRPLPAFYWTADTDMACMAAAIGQTKEEAYAHHIQRLMITGNFAMLAGVNPKEVHEWYLAVYADAYEWVELPNTLGMSQFADGGLLGSKPYAGGGNYINKMSDYCRSCRYSVKQKTGDGACPFNSLYWDFLDRNAEKLSNNPRLGPVYRTWARMAEDKRQAYRDTAQAFLNELT